jgi:hypothetical protein
MLDELIRNGHIVKKLGVDIADVIIYQVDIDEIKK